MSGFSEIVRLNPIELSGHVTVELFDALTGKKQNEIKGKNFISVKAAEYMRRILINQLLWGNAKFSCYPPIADAPFFQYLVLTDYAGSEAPTTDTLVRGNLVGWCRKYPSADADAKAGYANQNESWATPEQMHLVYDFATDKANGTFRSIYLAESCTPGIYAGEMKKTFVCKGVRAYETSLGAFKCTGGYFWCKLGNVVYKISMTTGEEVAAYDMLETVSSFTVLGGYIYYATSNGTNILKRYSLSGGTKETLTLSTNISELHDDGTYVYSFYQGSFAISRIDPATFTATYKTITPTDGYSDYGYRYVFIKGGVIHAVFNDNDTTGDPDTGYQPCTIDYAAGTATQVTQDWNQNTILATDGTTEYLFLSNTGYMGPSYTATNYAFYSTDLLSTGNYNIFSRKLLPADVTKASNQTMKITYDIFIT